MFDVGFSELALIFGASLVVLGPKRLPGLVAKVGRWVGKARAMARDFQQQLENEVNLEELQKLTEARTRAQETMPEPPHEFAGAPPDTPTYPYSSADSAATEPSVSADIAAVVEPAPIQTPVQADLDLSTPGDAAHAPANDARLHS
jgi:sec-independent protein translocase protein TatB